MTVRNAKISDHMTLSISSFTSRREEKIGEKAGIEQTLGFFSGKMSSLFMGK